jgi:ACR3 family arsenite efflux pump ArsB
MKIQNKNKRNLINENPQQSPYLLGRFLTLWIFIAMAAVYRRLPLSKLANHWNFSTGQFPSYRYRLINMMYPPLARYNMRDRQSLCKFCPRVLLWR